MTSRIETETEGTEAGVDLFWIPLGAGGSGFVRVNGRVYEAITAWRDRRPRLDLYHTALQVRRTDAVFIVETMWPCPDRDLSARGVVMTGPVWSRRLPPLPLLSYEVRRWQDGVLPDADQAVGGPQVVSVDPLVADRLLRLVPTVPGHVWGRKVGESGDWWNSNSVISWLLACSGIGMDGIRPPGGGRAPGWDAGIALARGEPAEHGGLKAGERPASVPAGTGGDQRPGPQRLRDAGPVSRSCRRSS